MNSSDSFHLSEIRLSDKAAYLEHLKERDIYVQTLRMPYPYTEDDFHQWMRIVEESTKLHGRPVHWAIRNQDDLAIGGCGFDFAPICGSHRAEIGYWLAKPYWGRGIMTGVVRKACEMAFAELGLLKIVAQVFADNRASVKVLEKCGFQQEGYFRKQYLKDGNFLDARVFALFKE